MSTGISSSNILWSAEIDDKTQAFFDRFNRNLDAIATRSNTIFGGVGTSAKKSGVAIGVVGGIVGGLTAQLVRMGIKGVQQFKALASSAIMLAARADTLAIALEVVGANVGYTKDELDALEKTVEANGITTIATRQTMLQLAQANLDLAHATELSRVAQDAAIIADINSSQATQRMIHGIVSLNPLILKHMGLYVDLQEEYKRATGASKSVTDNLSIQQKQLIALNAVLKAGKRIEGAYEAAMGTAGKQAGSTARFYEQLAVAIGHVAQPAFLDFIMRLNQFLQDMTASIDDNQEAVEKFADILAEGMGFALDIVEKIVDALTSIPGLALTAIQQINQLTESEITEPEILTRLKQFAVVWVKLFAEQLTFIIGIVDTLFSALKLMFELMTVGVTAVASLFGASLTPAIEEANAAFAELLIDVATWSGKATEAGEAMALATAEWLGLIEKTGSAAEDAARRVVNAMNAIADETLDVIQKISELNDKIGKDLAEAAIEAERDIIEEAIRLARRYEDIARSNARRIESIHRRHGNRKRKLERDLARDAQEDTEDAADDRADVESDSANKILEIWIEYRRKLEDIRRDFEFDASEAARRNDAVTVARLIRQKNKEILEAGIDRDRDIEDEERDRAIELNKLKEHQERMRAERKDDADYRRQELEEALKDELAEAEIARKQAIADLEFALVREREIKDLYARWDMEDLQRKYDDELRMLGLHFADLEHIDEAGLRYLLSQHGQYITNDLALWEEYYNRLQKMAAQTASAGGGYAYNPNYTGGESRERDPGDSWYYQSGGVGITTKPQRVVIGESGPELVAAIPLSASVNYNHNINMSGSLAVNGVSPSAEANLVPAIMEVLAQFGQALLAKSGGM